MQNADVVIIGGGIVGLATAYRLSQRRPQAQVVVLEKEERIAMHQTGHNSGVLHSGIYYRPGSKKAVNCRDGKKQMEHFCRKNDIPFERCGKVIVATDQAETRQLHLLKQRAVENGVDCRLLAAGELEEFEPAAAGVEAIHIPETGIVDFKQVALKIGELTINAGTQILTGEEVVKITRRHRTIVTQTRNLEVESKQLVNCGGLQSDRIAQLGSANSEYRIIPFRGEYFDIIPSKRQLCRNLIYPVPDPNFPFLGVHFTRRIDGSVECGPNAVLALAREGYHKTKINLRDCAEMVSNPGFMRLVAKHAWTGLGELSRSISKQRFVRSLQKLVPEIQTDHLVPTAAGVRAQAIDRRGNLVDDFLIVEDENMFNIVNAPSPAATSSLNIGSRIVDRLIDRL